MCAKGTKGNLCRRNHEVVADIEITSSPTTNKPGFFEAKADLRDLFLLHHYLLKLEDGSTLRITIGERSFGINQKTQDVESTTCEFTVRKPE